MIKAFLSRTSPDWLVLVVWAPILAFIVLV